MAERLEQVQRAFTTYTIERELGAGGMSTVYLAHDKKHDRKVAIKILHAELAPVLGAERFLQEIRVTANLHHPHILGLIDSGVMGEDAGELKGRPYYVMPFVEGESLRQRLEKEQQLPVSDSVRIATEVASALDYAHGRNVIHRDIKPENILLLQDGSAIVADFGIALAVSQARARMTQTGILLGTPIYMSPEQAMGERAITARSDIYSLGAVTYEMLSGEPPFTGSTAQAIIARVMTEEPRPLSTVRRNVPPNVAATVSRALERVPADRFSSAHDFAEALNNPAFSLSRGSDAAYARDRPTRRLRRLLYGVTALVILTTATTLWGWMRPTASRPVFRYSLAFDSAETMVAGAAWWGRLAISPDGLRLAYIGGPGGPRARLLVRPRNQLHATALPGSEGATTPFFSPDGQHVGFLTESQQVQFASIDGGPPIVVTDTLVGVTGASWGRDGFIYADGRRSVGLVRVEAKPGAVPKWFTALDTARGEFDHTWPDALPNGKGVLFTIIFNGKNALRPGTTFAIGVAEIPSGKHRVLVSDAMYARYAASGHLLYVTTNKTLMMVPFDQNSMRVTGEPTALIDDIRLGGLGAADLAVSESGTLIYATGPGEGNQELVWVARDGKTQSVDPDWQGKFWAPSLSPDGKQLAIEIVTPDGMTVGIWTKQLDRGPSVKLTMKGSQNEYPAWTPDGRSLTFMSNAAGNSLDLWTKRADGSGQARLQYHERRSIRGPQWSPDGKWLVFATDAGASGSGDILGIRPGVDRVAAPLVATKYVETTPALSPDGRWLAYTSNETGQYEIYVASFPTTSAAKWAVSTHGGIEPVWSHSGSELFYRDASSKDLVVTEVRTSPSFSLGRATTLFPAGGFRSTLFQPQYAVSADDRRFLMIRPAAANAADKLIVVDNWFEELKAKSRR